MTNGNGDIWVDSLAYDFRRNDPPYLPEAQRTLTATMGTDQVLDQVIQGLDPNVPMVELGAIVAILRAASLLHQTHHWQTRGGNYYGDHLLFERLYNDSQVFIDQVAERAVGTGSRDTVCPKTQAEQINTLVHLWCSTPDEPTSYDMVVVSLNVEKCVLECLKTARERLEETQRLSDGTDNLLQGVADKHEEFLYLLQQRAGGKVAYSYNRTAGANDERSRRNAVNKVLADMSKEYHVGLPVREISELLNKHGFDGSAMDGIYTGHDGKIHEKVGERSWISMTWHKMEESGRYEIVAYVS